MIQVLSSFFLASYLLLGTQSAFAHTLKVVSFNILAPPWASPSCYPDSTAPFLPRERRRAQILNVLSGLKDSTDIFCLQEITPIEYGYILEALDGFIGTQVNHSPGYWTQYVTIDPPWEPNGNAILMKKSVFKEVAFSDIALSSEGNHSVFAEAVHQGSDRRVRLFCVHLDSDHASNRKAEIGAAIGFLGAAGDSIDLIVGDLNSDPSLGSYCPELQKEGYYDLLGAVGIHEATMPITTEHVNMKQTGHK